MKKYISEMIGTMILVLMGCGSLVLSLAPEAEAFGLGIGFMGVSLAFGLSVLAMIYTIGGISACHINPAVTVAMWIFRKIETKDAVLYVLFQIIGAILGAGILAFIVGNGTNLAVNMVDPYGLGFTNIQALTTEIVMTFLLLMVIFGSTSNKVPTGFAGIAVGLSVALIHLVSLPITNTSINPARSFGPALIDVIFGGAGNGMADLWIFVLGPVVGAILAAMVWRYISKG
ncbi:aquaporin [Bacteroidales bacterium]|nr:aquaporin [Bacteroidales bacterium]